MEQLGFVSTHDLVKMIKRGIPECDVNVADVYRALCINGESLGSLRGKTRRSKTESVYIEEVPKEVETHVTLHVDITFVDNIPFLACVVAPISLTMVQLLGSKQLSDLLKALLHIMGKCRAEGFVVRAVLSDGEVAICKLNDELQSMGVIVNPNGAGSHVPVIENKIKTIKKRVRGHINTLPFRLCTSLLVRLVYDCVSRLNLVPTSTMSTEFVCPPEAFTGMRLDYKRDLRLRFGQYCEIHEQHLVTNTMASRTKARNSADAEGQQTGDVAVLHTRFT